MIGLVLVHPSLLFLILFLLPVDVCLGVSSLPCVFTQCSLSLIRSFFPCLLLQATSNPYTNQQILKKIGYARFNTEDPTPSFPEQSEVTDESSENTGTVPHVDFISFCIHVFIYLFLCSVLGISCVDLIEALLRLCFTLCRDD